MFRPSQSLTLQKLETLAALIALSIGLDLPPVNFYAIASRYLQKLYLPEEKILPHACRIYECSMPPDLWLSTNEFRLPTRVCVMSILIVAIRILYNLHGFGEWEKSISRGGSSPTLDRMEQLNLTGDFNSEYDVDMVSGSSCQNVDDLGTKSTRNPPEVQKSELDAAELLHKLGARYNEIADTYEHSKDLPTYLQYCKDVAFAGLEPTFENHEEERLIEEFWEFYQNEDSEPAEALEEEHYKKYETLVMISILFLDKLQKSPLLRHSLAIISYHTTRNQSPINEHVKKTKGDLSRMTRLIKLLDLDRGCI